jgi:hypothetical protein
MKPKNALYNPAIKTQTEKKDLHFYSKQHL